MFYVRRVVASGFLAPAGIGAIVAVLAAANGFAQSATKQTPSLRPAFEDSEEPRRAVAPRPLIRPDRRPAGALPDFDSPETSELPNYGNPPGFGASKTGYISIINTKRRPARSAVRRGAKIPGSSGTLPAPLSLTAPGSSLVSASSGTTGSGTSARSTTGTKANASATTPVPATPGVPRNSLVRIPDGTATGGTAGTVNTTRLTTSSATLLRRRTAAEEDPYAQLGMRTGAFLVLPAVEVTGGYDTSPARTSAGRGSTLLTVSPELIARSDWQRHEVTATLRGSYTTYGQTPELDRPAFDGKMTGRLDVTRDTSLIGEGTFIVGTDNPGSPNVQAGLTRFPIYTTLGGTFGLTQRFNRVEVTAKGTVERTEYQQSEFTDGTTASNHDRDYKRYAGTLRTSYDLMPGLKPFVEVSADTREHDLQLDRAGVQRDSTGWIAKAGSTFEFSRKLTGEVALGWIQRKYADPSLQELNGFLFDASLIYSMSALTKVKLTAATTAGETTVVGTAGILTRNAGIEVEHAFRRWLVGALKFNYGLDDYVGSSRKDDRYSISGTLTYKLNRMAAIKGEVRQEWLRSSTPGADYMASVFLLGLRLQR
jgi:hypothetical protein